MKHCSSLIIVLLSYVLTGCSFLPKYDSTKDESIAYLKTATSFNGSSTNVCVDGKIYELVKDKKTDYMVIPANKRIDISQRLSFDSYDTRYTCSPAISFIAKEGEKYITDTSITRRQCNVIVVKEDEESITGVTFETSLDKARCQ